MTLDRDAVTTDALLTDLYLDALLAGAVLDAAASGSTDDPARQLDPAARRAAERLRHDLVRVHPSFRFEERLATRLAEAAVAMRLPVAVGAEGRIVAFRRGADLDEDAALDPDADAGPDATRGGPDQPPTGPGAASSGAGEAAAFGRLEADPARRVTSRPLLIGGALTSAALSIAGAAYVAWRFGRPGRASTPMARAARAVRDARLASTVGSAITAGGRASVRRLD